MGKPNKNPCPSPPPYQSFYIRMLGLTFFRPSNLFHCKDIFLGFRNLFVQSVIQSVTDWLTCTLQLGQIIMYYTPKKVLPFAFFFKLPRPSKTGKESFLRQILLILWFDTYESKQTKIWMIFNWKVEAFWF